MNKVAQGIFFALTVVCVVNIQEGHGQDAIILGPCSPEGIFEVVEKSQENVLTCTVNVNFVQSRFEWQWINGTTRVIGSCPEVGPCDISVDLTFLFFLSVTSPGTVQLTINTTDTTKFSRSETFANSTILCTDYPLFSSVGKCRTDFIYPAKDTHCTAQFVTSIRSSWSTAINCSVTKTYSALRRYNCQLLAAQDAVGSPVTMVTTPLGTDYVSGSCSMTSGLPSVDGNITVMIIPGRINVTAAVIKRPVFVHITHSCPDYVEEGSDLNCMCTADNLGSPSGFLQWQGDSSAQLGRSNVTKVDNGTAFTCQLLWNAAVEASVTYRLKVTWRPSRLTHNCPQYIPEGSDVNCTCFSSDAGNPPGSCQWVGRGRDSLSLQKVSLDDHGKQLECQMTWRGETIDSVTYTMVFPEYLIRQARSEGKASGLGAGIGIGLAIAVIAVVAVAVVFYWRRGRTLPCAGKDVDTEHTLEMGSGDADSITPKTHEREPKPGNYENVNDPPPEDRPGMYDGLRCKEENVPSAYEDLQLDQRSGLSFTPIAQVARVPDTKTHGDVPAAKKKKVKIRTQNEDGSPSYSNMQFT